MTVPFFRDINFNPRLHEGGDTAFSIYAIINGISIHASMKEATI